MQDMLHKILSKHTDQPVEKIAEDFDRDYFMDAPKAVDYGLIDQVLKTDEEMEDEPQDAGEDKDKEAAEETEA
jgi:ATP-dependent Clp protease protease subunit